MTRGGPSGGPWRPVADLDHAQSQNPNQDSSIGANMNDPDIEYPDLPKSVDVDSGFLEPPLNPDYGPGLSGSMITVMIMA